MSQLAPLAHRAAYGPGTDAANLPDPGRIPLSSFSGILLRGPYYIILNPAIQEKSSVTIVRRVPAAPFKATGGQFRAFGLL